MGILWWAFLAALLILSLIVIYQWALAVASVLPVAPIEAPCNGKPSRFIVLIPAHNEEYDLPQALSSLERLCYPADFVRIVVVADRCKDRTAAIAREYRIQCLERFGGQSGKGAAIAWAIGELQKDLIDFDAVVVLDADTATDPYLLDAFNDGLIAGHNIQQAYNGVSNMWETFFTRLIAVTSNLRNSFFYKGKSRLGLSGMLMGTGMCFSRQMIETHRWTAFSVGEDWEYSVALLLAGERIHFNSAAQVFARESRGLRQASPQRLRWASGRYVVASASIWRLLVTGIRFGRLDLFDAALTLLAPNYSTQATLLSFGFVTAWTFASAPEWHFLFVWAGLALGSLCAYFALGVLSSKVPIKALIGILVIPVFLPWRMAIELLGLLGYGRQEWLRTPRKTNSRQGREL